MLVSWWVERVSSGVSSCAVFGSGAEDIAHGRDRMSGPSVRGNS